MLTSWESLSPLANEKNSFSDQNWQYLPLIYGHEHWCLKSNLTPICHFSKTTVASITRVYGLHNHGLLLMKLPSNKIGRFPPWQTCHYWANKTDLSIWLVTLFTGSIVQQNCQWQFSHQPTQHLPILWGLQSVGRNLPSLFHPESLLKFSQLPCEKISTSSSISLTNRSIEVLSVQHSSSLAWDFTRVMTMPF